MPVEMIPAIDPAPLPGPPWLFHLLWVVTFLIHLLFVNTILGGTLLAAIAGSSSRHGREIQRVLTGLNLWAVSLAITFGIAPLLFMQVLFGRFFYSATILLGWAWFGMLGLLTVGYYLNYVAKHRLEGGRSAAVVLWVEAACFVAIAAIQVAINLLHLQPGRWSAVADSAWSALGDPSFVPRFLHFILAAVGMVGALLAWIAVRRAGRGSDTATCAGMARFGIRAALITTVLQIADGFWLLLTLPADVLKGLMRGGGATMGPISLGIVVALALLVILARIQDPLAQATRVKRVMELMVGVVTLMVLTRHQLRGIYLAAANPTEGMTVSPQWGVFALFLTAFLGCLGLTAWAVVRALRDRPGAGEPTA